MKKLVKHLLIIGFVMIVGFNTFITNAKAASTFEVNGVDIHYYDFTSEPNKCWTYANKIYYKIWGVNCTTAHSALSELSVDEMTLTEEHLKQYVSKAPLGSIIRVTDYAGLWDSTESWGHSQVIVQKDEHGFTVVEGGMAAAPHCREYYYTWSEYCNTGWLGGRYPYIKYIIWPQATSILINEEAKVQLEKEMENYNTTFEQTNLLKNVLQVTDTMNETAPKSAVANSAMRTLNNNAQVMTIEESINANVSLFGLSTDRIGLSMVLIAGVLYKYVDKKCKASLLISSLSSRQAK